MSTLRAVRAASYPAYATCDVGTVWPDSSDTLDLLTIVVDDSVVLSSSCPQERVEWIELEVEIVKSYTPSIVASITVSGENANKFSSSEALGLPVAHAATLRCSTSNVTTYLSISKINGSSPGIIGSNTIIVRANNMHQARYKYEVVPAADFSSDTSIDNHCSSISVVKEIMHRVILPYVVSSLSNLVPKKPRLFIHGLLLVGPPGVGKTYAVKAVQKLCLGVCKVRIFEVSIPGLLSETDPIAELCKIFETVRFLKRIKVPSLNTNTQSPAPMTAIASTPSTSRGTTFGSPEGKTPSFMTGKSSSTKAPGGFLSGGTVSSKKNNTFTYRSPAAMSRSDGTTITPSGGASTPLTAFSFNKKLAASESPEKLRSAHSGDFTGNHNISAKFEPEMVFIVVDEIDALGTNKQQNEKQMAIKQFLCQWLDSQSSNSNALNDQSDEIPIHCCIVGTSNRSSDIDPSLRRGGRLEHEIAVTNSPQDRYILLFSLLRKYFTSSPGPREKGKETHMTKCKLILSEAMCESLSEKIAMQTGGYVAADLSALVQAMYGDLEPNQSMLCQSLNPESPIQENGALASDEEAIYFTVMNSFQKVAKSITPSCLRGAAISLPKLTYDDVIGYSEVKKSLQRVLCFARPEQQILSERFGLRTSPGGVLLFGPPGNSKTRLASAAAAHHGLPMISLSAADIYSPYVGDAEAEVRRAFQLARQAAPCVLFIDELDSIVTNRDTAGGGSSSSSASVEGRVLATLLTEMDGIQNSSSNEYGASGLDVGARNSTGGVIVLGATNRLGFLDAALIRKGRFHHVLHVPPPNREECVLLLQYFAEKCHLDESVVNSLSEKLRDGMSGAEVENLCREATIQSLHIHFQTK